MWYQKIGNFFRHLSNWWIIVPVLMTLFNAIMIPEYQTVEQTINDETYEVVMNKGIDISSFRAFGNCFFFLLFIMLLVIKKYFKDSAKNSEYKRTRETMDTLCEEIHTLSKMDDTYRVSIFEKENDSLLIFGRFSVYESKLNTDVKFRSDMGSVGIAFFTGRMHQLDNLPDFKSSPDKYFEIMKEQGNMEKDDVVKLSRKHRSYLSVPIKCHRSGSICSVLVIDCSEPCVFSKNPKMVEEVSNLVSNELVTLLFPKVLIKEIGG